MRSLFQQLVAAASPPSAVFGQAAAAPSGFIQGFQVPKGRVAYVISFRIWSAASATIPNIRWHITLAVAEVLGLTSFDEDDLYDALDDLSERQEKIEQALYRRYLRQEKNPPRLFLYDVTSSYLQGEHNALGAFGYNRDPKRGKLQIVIGLLTDEQGEPLAVRVFEGNSGDPTTVADQIRILPEQFQVTELVFVGDRGMVKSKGKQALDQAQLHYITALTDPQIRRLLGEGILQLPLFS